MRYSRRSRWCRWRNSLASMVGSGMLRCRWSTDWAGDDSVAGGYWRFGECAGFFYRHLSAADACVTTREHHRLCDDFVNRRQTQKPKMVRR